MTRVTPAQLRVYFAQQLMELYSRELPGFRIIIEACTKTNQELPLQQQNEFDDGWKKSVLEGHARYEKPVICRPLHTYSMP